jgi:adenylosuccinate synthase
MSELLNNSGTNSPESQEPKQQARITDLWLSKEEKLELENYNLKIILLQRQINDLNDQYQKFLERIEEKYKCKIVNIISIENGHLKVEKEIAETGK